jgi:CRP-like cAMP-binding protein
MLTPLFNKLEHFLPLPQEDRDWLDGLVSRITEFAAHQNILREDEPAAGVFVVMAGHACRYKMLPDGGRQILDFMFAGDMIEPYGVLLRRTDCGIVTTGPTAVAWLDHDRLLGEIGERPSVSLALAWSWLQQTAILRERIAVIGRRDTHARIAHLLCEIFERLQLIGEAATDHFTLPLTQIELADALGVSEVHANRMLRQLQRERLVTADHRSIRIPDTAALRAAAAFDNGYLHLQGAPAAACATYRRATASLNAGTIVNKS